MKLTISRTGYPDFELVGKGDVRDELASCGEQTRLRPTGPYTDCGRPATVVLIYQAYDGFGEGTADLYAAPRCKAHAAAARKRIARDGIATIDLAVSA